MSRAVLACAAVALALPASACGGSRQQQPPEQQQLLPAPRSLSVLGIGTATRIEAFGHSYVAAYGIGEELGFYSLVARHFGIARAGQGGGGGAGVIDQLADVYRLGLRRRSGPRVQLALVMWGINDLGQYGRAGLPAVRNGLTSLISRIRVAPGDAYTFAHGSVRLSGRWRTRGNVTATTSAASIRIRVPRRLRGRTFGFVAPASRGAGAVYRFSVDDRYAGRLDTRRLSSAERPQDGLAGTPLIKRIDLQARARTVSVKVSGVVDHAEFLGWHAEAAHPPLVAVVRQPRLPGYRAYARAAHPVGDDDIAALNEAIGAAAAAFGDGRVVVADADPQVGGDDAYFQDDRLHPNAIGHELLARRSIEALERAGARLRGRAGG